MRPTLAQRVAAARRRAFVGRAAEFELFRRAVDAPGEPPFTVLHVHGPGGIGKSALLRMFRDLAVAALVVRVVARDLAPGPDALRPALAPLAAADSRAVLLVDTYELLAPLDAAEQDGHRSGAAGLAARPALRGDRAARGVPARHRAGPAGGRPAVARPPGRGRAGGGGPPQHAGQAARRWRARSRRPAGLPVQPARVPWATRRRSPRPGPAASPAEIARSGT
ncbi:AAA family ATPase [Pseudonocardia sp.]|uniref:AAA family ATPase n=1 Tax=Pseudonocardia sp. TaxID=60912 RepID=UPI002602D1F0|nr:AAA family ATPase [Pseudonocardia sp.]